MTLLLHITALTKQLNAKQFSCHFFLFALYFLSRNPYLCRNLTICKKKQKKKRKKTKTKKNNTPDMSIRTFGLKWRNIEPRYLVNISTAWIVLWLTAPPLGKNLTTVNYTSIRYGSWEQPWSLISVALFFFFFVICLLPDRDFISSPSSQTALWKSRDVEAILLGTTEEEKKNTRRRAGTTRTVLTT